MNSLLLVFSDLDGSLLDHYSYNFEAAREQLEVLRQAAVPLILASSKTRAEIEPLRAALGNGHPFIVENGAAVFIPEGYFAEPPADTVPADGYRVRQWALPRAHWLQLLARLEGEYGGEFTSFHAAGSDGIQALTGLDATAAARANQRDFSEPVRWLGDAPRKAAFIAELQAAGATVQQGGRFLAVAGDCDKGRALRWLRDLYAAREPARDVHDIAIGDSANDCPMLEVAETALLIRSPVHAFPALQRSEGIWHSSACGPAGWAEGIDRWLQRYHIATKE
ncbi:HAD-IIB family hydrolase [Kineobactrum salinum]|uniref:HAD-IIB family hydrolase n=1 Tax=Kineobactrum salinum TaxID=2708301 RepID=A0A6C0U9G8_9GAMM|nr:HAD-IIB family hydrolase [Kineobactrum salinum]QIB66304.1 HAD-IIB family hydrolase [Kineobactrum salinum]